MKKFIMFVAVLFTAIGLTGCFGELESLEWETLPKSVYVLNDPAATTFMKDVFVKINGAKVSLQDAVDEYGATVSGFNVASEGERVITVKYKSLTIYWAYVVGEPIIPTFEPSYDWYDDDSANEFTLANENDLYGFANIVNGKDGRTADNFAGKTVKLGKNMDLTGKIWTPIGEGARKKIEEVSYEDLPHDDVRFAYENEGELTSALDTHVSDEKDFESYIFLCSSYFAQKEEDVYKYYHSSSDGATGRSFSGTFDGQGYTITGLSDIGYTPLTTVIYANKERVLKGYVYGLFGLVSGNVVIKNLTVENIQIVGAYYDVSGEEIKKAEIDSVGAIIGFVFGIGNVTIDNVKVLSGSINAFTAAGGLVGRMYNSGNQVITNCENRANITILDRHAGGLVGYAKIMNSNYVTRFENFNNYGNILTFYSDGKTAGAITNWIGDPNGSCKYSNYSITKENIKFINCKNFGNITGCDESLQTGKGMIATYYNVYDFVNCSNYGIVKTKHTG